MSRLITATIGTDSAFVLGSSKPFIRNPDAPTASDNVGAAYGWNGTTLTTVTGDYTIPTGTTVTDTRFQGYVTFTDATSVARNCVFEGRAPGGAFSAGLALGNAGGTLDRCTLRASLAASTYYMNAVSATGGTWTLTRCHLSRTCDGVHFNGTGTAKLLGCDIGPYAFYDTDTDHATDTVHPFWSHGDVLQRLAGLTNNDEITGCNLHGFFDMTGVTVSGGVYSNGAGSFGNPAAAMNGNGKDTSGTYGGNGSTTAYPGGNYANLISYTKTSPYRGMKFDYNWLDGGSHPSGMIQITTGTGHSVEIIGNRFGLGGKPGGTSSTIFLVSFPSDTAVVQSGNIFDYLPSVPTALQGTALAWTAGGAKITGV